VVEVAVAIHQEVRVQLVDQVWLLLKKKELLLVFQVCGAWKNNMQKH
jgi:hypothetical protein